MSNERIEDMFQGAHEELVNHYEKTSDPEKVIQETYKRVDFEPNLESLGSYLKETMSVDGDDQINLGLGGMTFNVYLKCQGCGAKFDKPVIVLKDSNTSASIVDSDCKSNIVLDDEDEDELEEG